MNYEKKCVWSILFRLCHWGFALSIVFLVVTGFYIHDPWTNTWIEGGSTFPMANLRYFHFLAGFVFTASVLARIYLYLFGNKQERVLDAAPVTTGNVKNLFSTMTYYVYATDCYEKRLGHNVLAGLTYLLTYVVAAAQLVSGFFMLYPESTAWQSWGYPLFGSQQQARFVHHLIMWYFLLFVVIHIYLVVWNDVRSPQGLISSIFNGYKFKPKNDSSAKA
ncbi:MAG: Ni/Fe-hydrogenase, b-type cytochrome subunit [Deltaproteobacteria bacterium]|nr:Ni/Fe-hydrogenase, b-type cytochrome subunit [Deltaproteobacteria bacterium]